MEANGAQNGLEKEITTLRDTNRTLQLRLRDIEVANDDFEMQARHTNSSLEDLESKYSQAIERSVLMEEEIRLGEQEREALRIETQRLREELSDLKIEAEILQDKIKKAENRQSTALSTDLSVLESPLYEDSPRSTASSPLIRTPPEVDLPSPVKDMTLQDPPSPPMSDASTSLPRSASKPKMSVPAPSSRKAPRLPSSNNVTPRPRSLTTAVRAAPSQRPATGARTPVNSRPANVRTSSQRSTTTQRTTASQRSAAAQRSSTTSTTLTHIRTLAAQMQRLEARVHNVRSKLPAPTTSPPRASPRGSAMSNYVPSAGTVRSRHGGPGSTTSSTADETPQLAQGNHIPRLSMSGVSRLSFGPLPNRNQNYDPDSSSVSYSRPSSRASFSSSQYARPERPPSRSELPRPMSRSSFGRAKTPSGPPPRASMSISQHSHAQSFGYMDLDELDESDFGRGSSRTSYNSRSEETSGIPLPSAIPMPGMSSAIPVPGRSSTISGPRTTSGRAAMGRSSTISGRAPSLSFRTSTTRRASVMHKKPVDLGETY